MPTTKAISCLHTLYCEVSRHQSVPLALPSRKKRHDHPSTRFCSNGCKRKVADVTQNDSCQLGANPNMLLKISPRSVCVCVCGGGDQKQSPPINFNRSFIKGANEPCCTSRMNLLRGFSICLLCWRSKFQPSSRSSTFTSLNYRAALCFKTFPAARLCVSACRTVDVCSNGIIKIKERRSDPFFPPAALTICTRIFHFYSTSCTSLYSNT